MNKAFSAFNSRSFSLTSFFFGVSLKIKAQNKYRLELRRARVREKAKWINCDPVFASSLISTKRQHKNSETNSQRITYFLLPFALFGGGRRCSGEARWQNYYLAQRAQILLGQGKKNVCRRLLCNELKRENETLCSHDRQCHTWDVESTLAASSAEIDARGSKWNWLPKALRRLEIPKFSHELDNRRAESREFTLSICESLIFPSSLFFCFRLLRVLCWRGPSWNFATSHRRLHHSWSHSRRVLTKAVSRQHQSTLQGESFRSDFNRFKIISQFEKYLRNGISDGEWDATFRWNTK